MAGRFAPSPTGPLHVGNLRTALVAWLSARASGERFVLRMEDLDRVTSSPEHERSQRDDLTAIGLDWDGDVLRQSERFDVYDVAIAELDAQGLVYECFCSRREIREAATAPHGPSGTLEYPGTCRHLSATERATKRRDRPPALRFRSSGGTIAISDLVAGRYVGPAGDVVLRRNDGVPAYNLAVVVDDAAQSITEVIRGDDLLASTPGQVAIQRALGLPTPRYAHIPLVVGRSGQRLAKRDGSITLADLAARGVDAVGVRSRLAASLGIADGGGASLDLAEAVARFDCDRLADLSRGPVRLEDLLSPLDRALPIASAEDLPLIDLPECRSGVTHSATSAPGPDSSPSAPDSRS